MNTASSSSHQTRGLTGVPPGVAALAATFVACAVAALPASAAEGTAPQSWSLRAGPLKAEARLLHEDPAGPQLSGQYVFTITVHGEAGDQVMTTAVKASSLDEAIKIARAGTVWRSPYLFVHLDRGIGNRPDGRREAVFEVLNGKLVSLGQLIDLGDGMASYRGRHFVDYWVADASQQMGLCRDCAPVLRIQLVDRDGHLEVQRSVTWSANQDSWQANAQLIAHPPTDNASDPPDSADNNFASRLSYFQAVVKNAMLAKYCGKTSDLLELLSLSAPHLNSEQRQDLRDALAMLAPLTPPSETRPALYALNVELKSTP